MTVAPREQLPTLRGRQTQAAIDAAARAVIARKGILATTISDIAAEAGIADGTVYLYFKSKDEILHSIFDRAMEEFIAEGKRELAEISGAGARLTRIAELHLEKLGADRDLAVVFQVELRGSTKFMREFSAAGFGEYLEIIRQTIEDGQRDIPIEERDAGEVLMVSGRTKDGKVVPVEIAAPGSPARNDAFDVTPARLITGLITERGVAAASREGLLALYPERA